MLFKSLVAEAIATFGLCFIGAGAIMANEFLGDAGPGLLGIAIAHGLILAIMVTATMNVSGGHVNPAVTASMLVTGRISLGRGLAYIAAQCGGGMLAGLLLSSVMFANVGDIDVVSQTWNGTPHVNVDALGATDNTGSGPRSEAERAAGVRRASFKAVGIEMVLTFFLVFAVFGTAVDPRHPNVGGFGIGLTIAADILVGGPLTGAAMNPARVLGTGFLLGGAFWAEHWVYWVGPLAGGILAGFVYDRFILDRSAPAGD